MELQSEFSEDIYDSGGEQSDCDRKPTSSFKEKGKKIIRDWVDKLKPDKINSSSISPSYDSDYLEDDRSSSRSENSFEGMEEEENIETIRSKIFLNDLCMDTVSYTHLTLPTKRIV